MPQRLIFSLLVFVAFFIQVAVAQPPGIRRWGGRTANIQSQGFSQGDPLVLTWSIAPDQTTLSNGDPSDLVAYLDGIYDGGMDEYQPILQDAIGRWGEVSGLTIEFEPEDDSERFSNRFSASGDLGVRGDIRFGGRFIDGFSGTLAFANFPTAGDVTVDTGDNFYLNLTNDSIRLRNVIAHEFGHALGFFSVAGHVVSSDTRQLLEPFASTSFDGPQYHDILSVQRGYGDIYETGLGNDTPANATDLGILLNGDSVVLGDSAHRRGNSFLFSAKPTGIEIQPDEVDFISIDDQSDTDVYSFTVEQDGAASIVLEPLGETYQAGGQDQDNQISFDTSERVRLAVELLATDGQTVLATSGLGSIGDVELLGDVTLDSSGTYFVRITGVNNPDELTLDTQFYGLLVNFEGTLFGDVNLDQEVNSLDISPFIFLLSMGDFQEEADLNQDGLVDFLDISPFVNILSVN